MKPKDFDFRIWHKDSESFVDMKVSGTDLRIIPTDDDSMELELWSGFYDSKGAKIYEGDIVICNTLKFIVEYKRGKFRLRQIAENGFSLSLHYSETLEVLGNIHENAELLKEQDEAKKLHNQRLCRSLRRYH